jgi:hypothetical protein
MALDHYSADEFSGDELFWCPFCEYCGGPEDFILDHGGVVQCPECDGCHMPDWDSI